MTGGHVGPRLGWHLGGGCPERRLKTAARGGCSGIQGAQGGWELVGCLKPGPHIPAPCLVPIASRLLG